MTILLWIAAAGFSLASAVVVWVVLTIAYELFRADNW